MAGSAQHTKNKEINAPDCQQKRQQRCSNGVGPGSDRVGLCSCGNLAFFGRKQRLKRPIPTLASIRFCAELRWFLPALEEKMPWFQRNLQRLRGQQGKWEALRTMDRSIVSVKLLC